MESRTPKLPDDVVYVQILPRLPAKSLMRFKCVSKHWSSLTRTNPPFLRAYKHFHPNAHLLLLHDHHLSSLEIAPATVPQRLHIPNLHNHNDLHIQTANGLICLLFGNSIYTSLQSGNSIPVYIFNPSTRESVTIEPFYSESLIHNTHWYFVEYNSFHFGFDPRTNEYKVLHVTSYWSFDFDRLIKLKIFTLGTASWREVDVDSNHDDVISFDHRNFSFHNEKSIFLCLRGAIHWINRNENMIVVFDFADEKFRTIPLPVDYLFINPVANWIVHIVEVDQCVAIFDCMPYGLDREMKLWILKDYENRVWVKEAIVFPDPLKYELRYTFPLENVEAGGELLLKPMRGEMGRLVHLYNVEKKSVRPFHIRDDKAVVLTSYVENFVSLI